MSSSSVHWRLLNPLVRISFCVSWHSEEQSEDSIENSLPLLAIWKLASVDTQKIQMLSFNIVVSLLVVLVGGSSRSSSSAWMGIFAFLKPAHAFSTRVHRVSSSALSPLSAQRNHRTCGKHPTTTTTTALGASGDDNKSSDDVDKWMEHLKEHLQSEQNELVTQNWREGVFETRTIDLDCFVRRLDVGTYPLAACGSSSGAVFVVDLEKGTVLAAAVEEENDNEPTAQLSPDTLELLYGPYDGGGTIAVAMDATNRCVCAAGRSGGVLMYKFDGKRFTRSKKLLPGVLVTALECLDQTLWVATATGQVMAFSLVEGQEVGGRLFFPAEEEEEQPVCWYEVSEDSPILALSLNPELGAGACATADGSIYVFTLETDGDVDGSGVASINDGAEDEDDEDDEDDAPILGIQLPEGSVPRIPHSLAIGRYKDGFAVFCGTSDGSLVLQPLDCQDANEFPGFLSCSLEMHEPLLDQQVEFDIHTDTVKCLVCPSPDLIVTGSADGSLNVLDLSKRDDDDDANDDESAAVSALYSIEGYKVWLGSVWTGDGRLVTDGSDNSIVVHDFHELSIRDFEEFSEEELGP
jgi:WD40 repeat protein